MLLACVVKKAGDLSGDGRHNSSVKESVEQSEQEGADNHGDQNLYAGIDVAFAAGVGDCGLCGNCDGIDLVGDGVKELFHKIITSISF